MLFQTWMTDVLLCGTQKKIFGGMSLCIFINLKLILCFLYTNSLHNIFFWVLQRIVAWYHWKYFVTFVMTLWFQTWCNTMFQMQFKCKTQLIFESESPSSTFLHMTLLIVFRYHLYKTNIFNFGENSEQWIYCLSSVFKHLDRTQLHRLVQAD